MHTDCNQGFGSSKGHVLWVVLVIAAFFVSPHSPAHAAPISPSIARAKQEAEAKGYVFLSNHDEIVAKAKGEGKMRALSGMSADVIKSLTSAFVTKYPFLETHVEEIEGTDSYQRFILEMKSGRDINWDVTYIPEDFYNDYVPFLKKFDVLGMASHGVLSINPKMVDPLHRNTIATQSIIQVLAYNKKLLPPEMVPTSWEDLLKPEFKGKKFVMDIRPRTVAGLVPAWGLAKVLDFSRKLAQQQPIWVRGGTRTITSMMAGEYTMMVAVNLHSVTRLQVTDKTGVLAYKVVEPVPTRLVPRADSVLDTARNPHAALLWLEFQASPEAQKIFDQEGPHQASILTPGSYLETETRGKQLSVVDWSHAFKIGDYSSEMVKAYGFPKAGEEKMKKKK